MTARDTLTARLDEMAIRVGRVEGDTAHVQATLGAAERAHNAVTARLDAQEREQWLLTELSWRLADLGHRQAQGYMAPEMIVKGYRDIRDAAMAALDPPASEPGATFPWGDVRLRKCVCDEPMTGDAGDMWPPTCSYCGNHIEPALPPVAATSSGGPDALPGAVADAVFMCRRWGQGKTADALAAWAAEARGAMREAAAWLRVLRNGDDTGVDGGMSDVAARLRRLADG